MSSDKKHENVFKFGVYQGNDTILERIFLADYFRYLRWKVFSANE